MINETGTSSDEEIPDGICNGRYGRNHPGCPRTFLVGIRLALDAWWNTTLAGMYFVCLFGRSCLWGRLFIGPTHYPTKHVNRHRTRRYSWSASWDVHENSTKWSTDAPRTQTRRTALTSDPLGRTAGETLPWRDQRPDARELDLYRPGATRRARQAVLLRWKPQKTSSHSDRSEWLLVLFWITQAAGVG
jgi:hypothetical protein